MGNIPPYREPAFPEDDFPSDENGNLIKAVPKISSKLFRPDDLRRPDEFNDFRKPGVKNTRKPD